MRQRERTTKTPSAKVRQRVDQYKRITDGEEMKMVMNTSRSANTLVAAAMTFASGVVCETTEDFKPIHTHWTPAAASHSSMRTLMYLISTSTSYTRAMTTDGQASQLQQAARMRLSLCKSPNWPCSVYDLPVTAQPLGGPTACGGERGVRGGRRANAPKIALVQIRNGMNIQPRAYAWLMLKRRTGRGQALRRALQTKRV